MGTRRNNCWLRKLIWSEYSVTHLYTLVPFPSSLGRAKRLLAHQHRYITRHDIFLSTCLPADHYRFRVFLCAQRPCTFLPPFIFRIIPRRSLSAEITIIVCTIARRDEYSRKTCRRQRLLFVFFFSCENLTLPKSHKFGRFTCHDSIHVAAATSACTLLPYTQVCVNCATT